jgi:hypothetical protein
VQVVDVDRRRDGGVLALGGARHDVRGLALAAALDALEFLADLVVIG